MSNDFIKVYRNGDPVRRETAELFDEAHVGGQYVEVPFEREILWFRESSATVVLRHKGVEVDNIITLSDCHYEFLSAVREAMRRDAIDAVNRLMIDAESTLVVEVDVEITDHPALAIPQGHPWYEERRERRRKGYSLPYMQLSTSRWRRRANRERLEPVSVHELTVWSSTRHPHDTRELPHDVAKILDGFAAEAAELRARA